MHLVKHRLTFAMVTEAGTPGIVGMLSERDFVRFVTEAGEVKTSAALLGDSAANIHTISKWHTPASSMPSIRLTDTPKHALGLMRSRIWRHLPVMDHWGRMHAILDLRDVVEGEGFDGGVWKGKAVVDVLRAKRRVDMAAAAEGDAWSDQLGGYLRKHAAQHTISARASVQQAAWQMQEHRLAFLVVTEAGPTAATGVHAQNPKVAGVVTERSFMHFTSEWASGTRTIDVTTEDPVDGHVAIEPGVATISQVMTPIDDVLHVSLTAPVADAIDIFFSRNASHLPVIDQGRLSGIISIRDLLRPYLEADGGGAA